MKNRVKRGRDREREERRSKCPWQIPLFKIQFFPLTDFPEIPRSIFLKNQKKKPLPDTYHTTCSIHTSYIRAPTITTYYHTRWASGRYINQDTPRLFGSAQKARSRRLSLPNYHPVILLFFEDEDLGPGLGHNHHPLRKNKQNKETKAARINSSAVTSLHW